MTNSRTINASEMRSINLSAILELIRRESPISRTEIADRLAVSLPTVMRIVDDLTDDKLVYEDGETEWSGGRRRSLLRFNEAGYAVIGVDLGGTKMYGAVANLGGHIFHEKTVDYHGTTGEASYESLVALIDDLVAAVSPDTPIRGIGVGAPGVTLHEAGIVKWAPSLNWRDFPLKERLSAHFEYPVIVDNDVNLAALGELWFGLDEQPQNMVLVAIGTGIGAGIIIDGTLYRGTHEASGEVGYFLLGRESLGKRYEGFGAFESLASGTGITERARQTLRESRSADELATLTAEDVLAAARAGETWAEPIIADTVDYMALAIAGIGTLLDPEVIILGGGVAQSADMLVEPILKRIDGAIPDLPKIQVSRLGARAAVMGTIARIVQHTADYYVVRKLS